MEISDRKELCLAIFEPVEFGVCLLLVARYRRFYPPPRGWTIFEILTGVPTVTEKHRFSAYPILFCDTTHGTIEYDRSFTLQYFGEPRIAGSHHVFKMPWPGDPRINLQRDGSFAKPYQVHQVKKAIDRWEADYGKR